MLQIPSIFEFIFLIDSYYGRVIHTNKCTKTSYVINSFIKRLPQYVFRQFTLPSSGGSLKFYIDQCS
jgi:hypothetical protein